MESRVVMTLTAECINLRYIHITVHAMPIQHFQKLFYFQSMFYIHHIPLKIYCNCPLLPYNGC